MEKAVTNANVTEWYFSFQFNHEVTKSVIIVYKILFNGQGTATFRSTSLEKHRYKQFTFEL